MTPTRDDILTLPAGRDLDALVAGRVLGWRWWRFQPHWYTAELVDGKAAIVSGASDKPPHRYFAREPTNDPKLPQWDATPWDGVEELAVTGQGPPPYSTDIAAAWEVVEAMHAKGEVLSLIYCCGDKPPWDKLRYRACFRHSDSFAVDDAAPLAICHAALLAVAAEGKPL